MTRVTNGAKELQVNVLEQVIGIMWENEHPIKTQTKAQGNDTDTKVDNFIFKKQWWQQKQR